MARWGVPCNAAITTYPCSARHYRYSFDNVGGYFLEEKGDVDGEKRYNTALFCLVHTHP